MNSIANLCKELKKDITPRVRNPKKPVSCWSEKDRYQDEIVQAFVIILQTNGCAWNKHSGCTMCGYFNESATTEISDQDLLEQYHHAMKDYSNEPVVKIFTSGSFLDEKEISFSLQNTILSNLSEQTQKISIESRPSFITEKRIVALKKSLKKKDLEIGIGLETTNDTIRTFCINKGFSFQDYKKAALTLKKQKTLIKTYVLIKPPFLIEKQAIHDTVNTVNNIKSLTNTISFNPMNIQRHTVVEYLWKKNYYRAPWLWSITKILTQSKTNAPNLRLQCDISGGGKSRGAHNCKQCDSSFLNAISDFSLHQDPERFKKLDCSCKQTWLDQLELEAFSFGSLPDFNRWQ